MKTIHRTTYKHILHRVHNIEPIRIITLDKNTNTKETSYQIEITYHYQLLWGLIPIAYKKPYLTMSIERHWLFGTNDEVYNPYQTDNEQDAINKAKWLIRNHKALGTLTKDSPLAKNTTKRKNNKTIEAFNALQQSIRDINK